MTRAWYALPVLILGASLVAGCGSSQKKLGFCPGMAALVDASREPVFRPGTTADPSNLLFTLEIVRVKGSCDYDKKGKTSETSLEIHFRATRPPNGESAGYTMPYFVAVTQGDRIIRKTDFKVQFSFEPGASVAEFDDTVDSTEIVSEEGKKPYDYQILAGLPLNKDQLAFNKVFGRFAP